MRWPWERAAAAAATAAVDLQPGRCPECSGVEVAAVMDLKSWAIAPDGSVIERHIGYRYACQRCPRIYSVSSTGVFRQHPQSSPLTPEARPQRDEALSADPSGADLPPQYQRPIPKEKPRV